MRVPKDRSARHGEKTASLHTRRPHTRGPHTQRLHTGLGSAVRGCPRGTQGHTLLQSSYSSPAGQIIRQFWSVARQGPGMTGATTLGAPPCPGLVTQSPGQVDGEAQKGPGFTHLPPGVHQRHVSPAARPCLRTSRWELPCRVLAQPLGQEAHSGHRDENPGVFVLPW